MKKLLLALALLLPLSAAAQNVTNHAIPIGKGTGVQGWGKVGPCTSGQYIGGTGASSDPTCQNVPTSLPPSGPAGGDLTGTYPNPTLSAIGGAIGPIGSSTTVPVITRDAKGRVTALTSATITSAATAACGWRLNMQMAPGDNGGANVTTFKTLVGPASFVPCAGGSWIPGGSLAATDSIYVGSVGQGGTGTGTGLTSINVTSRSGAGCVSPCVSEATNQGGLDPGDPLGATLQANTIYNIFLVARSHANAPNDWGLVFSSRGCTSGPSTVVQNIYPYYTCIDWFWSNGAANAMLYMTVKQDHVWNFAGGTGAGGAGTALMPQIHAGVAAQWTLLMTNPSSTAFGASDNTGTFTLAVGALTAGTFVAAAPNTSFAGFTPCQAAGVGGGAYSFVQCQFTPDKGGFGAWSTDASGFIFLLGGVDGY